ncbi:RagB/SusD family nutrient uptake outer membrane protein [Sphingobacterium daejeonense]|uniref:RagB/SusD family nutrient uptake outer membrane protein n=1 Tax=Sphingobacterium daejeonense TaxID=371142 RepID=UPI003D30FFBD
MKNTTINTILCLCIAAVIFGCSDFLDEKPDQKLSVPVTLDDFQALMNELHVINISLADGEVASDDLYLTTENFDALGCEYEWDLYLWRDGPMTVLCAGSEAWRTAYSSIYNYNTVIEGLESYEGTKDNRYDDLWGQAHFYRGLTYLELAVIFTDAYSPSDAKNTLGLPLRLTTDFNEKSVRSDLEETFARIVSDLKIASQYLMVSTSDKLRPTKAAALGTLARTFLFMGDFDNAILYTDSCLVGRELLDYVSLDAESEFPFDRLNNIEIIFERYLSGYMSLYAGFYANVNPELYDLYEENDWRKKIFFTVDTENLVTFKGSYGGRNWMNFSGVAVDELYLTLAESCFRSGNINRAKQVMDVFISRRYPKGYEPAYTENSLLRLILSERRKQLLFRGTRFADIKRLNKMGDDITLKRVIRGEEYTLPANDPRFTILLPLDVVQRSGMEQNPR